MKQNDNCAKLAIWQDICKRFLQSILRMNALVDFITHCMQPETEHVLLNNPINLYGHIELETDEALPFVTSALTKEKESAVELARQMKTLLDEADFETWNCITVSPAYHAAVDKWKDTLKKGKEE